MRGISTGHSHPRPCSGRKTLRRCRNNKEADNVILIDVDSEHLDNVIFIDIPESLPKNCQGSSIHRKDEKRPFSTVICIDDDESPGNCHTCVDLEKGTFAAGASSSRSPIPPTNDFEDDAVQKRQFVQENVTPVRLSKCKRTYSGKASTGSSYGIDSGSESDSSADDYPDCELMEDTSGKLQEQWEKAFSRRKKGIVNGQSGMRDHNGASRIINGNHQQNVRRKGKKSQQKEAPLCCHTGKFNNEYKGPSPLNTKEDAHCGSTYVSHGRSDIHSPFIHAGQKDHQHFEPGSSSCHNGKGWNHPAPRNSSLCKQSTKNVGCQAPAFKDMEGSPTVEFCMPNSQSFVNENSCGGQGNSVEDEATINKCPNSPDAGIARLRSIPRRKLKSQVSGADNSVEDEATINKCPNSPDAAIARLRSILRRKLKSKVTAADKSVEDEATSARLRSMLRCNLESQLTASDNVGEKEHLEPCEPFGAGSIKERHNFTTERSSFVMSTSPDIQIKNNSIPFSDAFGSVSGESFCLRNSSLRSGDGISNGCHQVNIQSVSEMPLSGNVHLDEAKIRQGDLVSNIGWQEDRNDKQRAENGDTINPVESCVISEREKIKETDEYKRAIQEEWASRKQALQTQAEEAQRLRRLLKRRKAASLRLLDMERRQKQRVEEVRSTQKKDEENMNLREVVRAEIRKELSTLETTCHNMASLLHSFGIHIGGWPNPSPQEVQTAYKRALLTFHPDRASRSDIHHQVEAEEKFKLMTRLKEKFSRPS